MTSKGSKNLIIAVLISATLLMSSGVEAAGLLALGGDSASGERQIGLFEQAIQWLSGAWGDLTSAFAFSEDAPPAPTGTECTQNCGDAGPGIDPMG
ncbi:MAG: hypothetical protein ACLGI9_05915 [Thermoanaerobaculia bacterium]